MNMKGQFLHETCCTCMRTNLLVLCCQGHSMVWAVHPKDNSEVTSGLNGGRFGPWAVDSSHVSWNFTAQTSVSALVTLDSR